MAKPGLGMAHEWQLGLQDPATLSMERLSNLHNALLIVITLIVLFVLGLLVTVVVRFNRKSNPVPSKVSHNTTLEILWTAIPILILIGIAIPSLRLHYYIDKAEKADMTLKVVGRQWYWVYEYPDQGGVSFESRIKDDKDLAPGQPRLLAVDNPIVVPVDTTVRLQVTGGDVIHSWAMPAFGVKLDAVPGRLHEGWFRATVPGVYYGQCSELCGVDHGYMPIEVHVVPKQEFASWVAGQQKAAGIAPPQPLTAPVPTPAAQPTTTPAI